MPLNIGRDNLSLFPPKPYPLCLQSTHPSLGGLMKIQNLIR